MLMLDEVVELHPSFNSSTDSIILYKDAKL